MAAYKKGTQLPGAGFNKDAYLKRQASDIEGRMMKLGFTNKTTTPEGMTKYTRPEGSSPAIGQSYNNMMGGGSFGGEMLNFTPSSMGSLEAASMRLADAASRRGIAEKEAEAELGAKSSGYSSLGEMQRDIRSKRLGQEAEMKKQKEEEDMRSQGYVKVGGKWLMRFKPGT